MKRKRRRQRQFTPMVYDFVFSCLLARPSTGHQNERGGGGGGEELSLLLRSHSQSTLLTSESFPSRIE